MIFCHNSNENISISQFKQIRVNLLTARCNDVNEQESNLNYWNPSPIANANANTYTHTVVNENSANRFVNLSDDILNHILSFLVGPNTVDDMRFVASSKKYRIPNTIKFEPEIYYLSVISKKFDRLIGDLTDWFLSKHGRVCVYPNLLLSAAKKGQINLLEWLKSNTFISLKECVVACVKLSNKPQHDKAKQWFNSFPILSSYIVDAIAKKLREQVIIKYIEPKMEAIEFQFQFKNFEYEYY